MSLVGRHGCNPSGELLALRLRFARVMPVELELQEGSRPVRSASLPAAKVSLAPGLRGAEPVEKPPLHGDVGGVLARHGRILPDSCERPAGDLFATSTANPHTTADRLPASVKRVASAVGAGSMPPAPLPCSRPAVDMMSR
jgi:hypothetical protein